MSPPPTTATRWASGRGRPCLSDGGSSGLAFTPGSLPGVLQDVVDRGGPWLDEEIAPFLAAQDPFCLGYVTDCLDKMHVSAGVYLSVMCHDILPFAPPPAATSDPMFVRIFTSRADSEACARWNVGEAGDVGAPVDWDVPTLAFVGRFTPYVRVADVSRAVSALPNGSVLVDPGGADNVLPRTECTLTLRTEWLDNPTGYVETPQCLRREGIQWNLN